MCQFTETYPADLEFLQYGMRTTATLATRVSLDFKLRRTLLLNFHRRFCHLLSHLHKLPFAN